MSETRITADGRVLMKQDDGTIVEVKGRGAAPPAQAEAPAAETPSAIAEPPARPRRGDELTQPDPTPSGPITAPTPKPMLDITGSVARTQGEIRKGAPGEDVADAETRAKSIENQGNPIKDDWIAKELITGAVAGPVVGKAIGAVAPVVRRGLGAVADSTAGREAGRMLTKIAEGAGKKAREALGEVAPEAKELLKAKPWLAKGKTSADLAKNFQAEGKALAAQRDKLFELADARRVGGGDAVPEAVEGESTAAMSSPNFSPPARTRNVAGETGYEPPGGGRATATSENATQRLESPNFTPETGAAPDSTGGVGAPLSLVEQKIDERIAKLAKGTRSDREAAAAMASKKAELLKAHGETGAMPASKLRQEMSDYQTAFDKTATAASSRADKEMSKALGDALRSHVDDPALMSKIDALTDEMSVTTRAEKALKGKAKAEAAPGGPPTHGIIKQVAHDVAHSHGTPNAIAKVGKRVLSPVASVADRALGGVARRMDPAIADVVQRGVAEHWGAARLAREIASVQPAEAAEGSPGMTEPGNIDMNTRPHVKNKDGSISTVRSMGVNIDGQEVLIPTVSEDGRIMSDDEAVEQYKRTGRHLGKFSSVDASNNFAQKLHESEARKLDL